MKSKLSVGFFDICCLQLPGWQPPVGAMVQLALDIRAQDHRSRNTNNKVQLDFFDASLDPDRYNSRNWRFVILCRRRCSGSRFAVDMRDVRLVSGIDEYFPFCGSCQILIGWFSCILFSYNLRIHSSGIKLGPATVIASEYLTWINIKYYRLLIAEFDDCDSIDYNIDWEFFLKNTLPLKIILKIDNF